jgi:hypothetical protein
MLDGLRQGLARRLENGLNREEKRLTYVVSFEVWIWIERQDVLGRLPLSDEGDNRRDGNPEPAEGTERQPSGRDQWRFAYIP